MDMKKLKLTNKLLRSLNQYLILEVCMISFVFIFLFWFIVHNQSGKDLDCQQGEIGCHQVTIEKINSQ